MHDAPPASHDPPPTHVPDFQHDPHQPHHPHDPPVHSPPDEPPPSYDDATATYAAPPGYGTFRPYTDDSSLGSSEVERTDRALPEWVGQALVVFVFVSIIYGFWQFINAPEPPPMPGWPG